jgi:hypothetical protein
MPLSSAGSPPFNSSKMNFLSLVSVSVSVSVKKVKMNVIFGISVEK